MLSIEQFIEYGLFGKWMAETHNDIPAKLHLSEHLSKLDLIKNLKLSDLQSIFLISIILIFGCIFVFICEILISIKTNKGSTLSERVQPI